jgi:hypothetical protein
MNFIAGKYFHPFEVRVKIAHVHGVAVTQGCRVQALAIVVHAHGAPNNFITAISVYISHHIVVITLT